VQQAPSPLAQLRRTWRGLWLFARGREEEALAHFSDDRSAVSESFLAALIALIVSGLLMILADPENVSGLVDPFPVYVRDGLLAWAIWLLVAWLLAQLFGVGERFRLYVVTLNWTSAWLSLFTNPMSVLFMRLNDIVGAVAILFMLIFITLVMVRQTRASLHISTGRAIALNLAAFLATMIALVLIDPSILAE